MPRWAVLTLAVLAVLAAGAILLEGAVIFIMITRVHQTQMEVCYLYLREHVVVPPGCHR